GGGLFTITGSYTYAEEGNYSISVLITDVGGASISAASSAGVSDASLSASGLTVNSLEGNGFAGVVATFTDANVNAVAADFTAAISWGDGGSSAGTVTANGGGLFTITGNYTYAEEGNYSLSVLMTDVGGASISAASSAGVGDALLSANGVNINAVEESTFTGV